MSYLHGIPVPIGSLPPRAHLTTDAPRRSLNGDWRVRVDGGDWETRAVPSHFGTPAYTNVR